ncbi:hypothetical protein HOLleu_20188 [Holothuria leucospilota]|uniref:Uncharacterized protein n=1 Tax=Holothuria leucospilota TaxID=206669 RepID=A0A9Q1H5J4_HOLLE|nr:hypothetical protein HOLleu_20188 [Holothuria leucospilota]
MNVTLCKEVDLINPFQYKERTKERGQAWDTIADNLQKLKYCVTKWSVRDRYKLLKDQVLKKNREDAKASGISTDEVSNKPELTQIIEELVEVEKERREQQTEIREKEEKKEQDGAEMRRRALESFAETSKRYFT